MIVVCPHGMEVVGLLSVLTAWRWCDCCLSSRYGGGVIAVCPHGMEVV